MEIVLRRPQCAISCLHSVFDMLVFSFMKARQHVISDFGCVLQGFF